MVFKKIGIHSFRNSQQTFKKWQDDWDTYVKQNQEKMQTRNAKMRAQWERKQSES